MEDHRQAGKGTDVRRYIRARVETTVTVTLPGGEVVVMRSRDISTGGAFLETVEPSGALPAVGTIVQMAITDDTAGDDNTIEVEAMVVRVAHDGIALEYTVGGGHRMDR